MLRFTYRDGSRSFSALHRVQRIYYNDNSVLTVRVDRADGYREDFAIKVFGLLETGRVYS